MRKRVGAKARRHRQCAHPSGGSHLSNRGGGEKGGEGGVVDIFPVPRIFPHAMPTYELMPDYTPTPTRYYTSSPLSPLRRCSFSHTPLTLTYRLCGHWFAWIVPKKLCAHTYVHHACMQLGISITRSGIDLDLDLRYSARYLPTS